MTSLRVGLTGGTGAGKSHVATILANLGAGIIDADAVAREVVAPGSVLLTSLAREFGADIIDESGHLRRSVLGERAFATTTQTQALNALMHPAIAAATRTHYARLADHDIVVHDVPLLSENELGGSYHLCVCVSAPLHIRLVRLTGPRGLSIDTARARIAAQTSESARMQDCDVELANGGDATEIEATVNGLWTSRIVPFARNVKAGRPASSILAASELLPHEGAAAESRLCRRIAHHANTANVSMLDIHAVPATAGRYADVRVTMSSTRALEALSGTLADGGFFPAGEHELPARTKRSEPGLDSGRRELFGSDPGQPVRVVLEVTNPGMR